MAGPQAELKDHRIPLEKGRERGWGKVSIPADANPADNDFWFVFDQPAPRRAVVVAEDAAGRPAARNWPRRSRPTRRCSARPRSSAPRQLAAVDWDKVVAPALAGPAARGRCGQAGAGVRRARRAGDLLPAAVAGRRRVLRRAAGRRGSTSKDGRRRRDLAGRPGPAGAHARAARPLPVGQLAGPAVLRPGGRAHAAGDPQGRRAAARPGRRPSRGGAYFCATTPGAGDSSLATGGVVLYVLVQRALAGGAAVLGSTRQLVGRRAAGRGPARWKRLGGAEEALSTDYAAPPRRLRVGRPAARREPPGRGGRGAGPGRRRVAELFRGLDFARVDDQAGNLGVADPGDLAAVPGRDDGGDGGRGRLCLPKAGRGRAGGRAHERLAVAHVPLDALVARASRSSSCWSTAGFCFVAWRRSGYRPVDGAARAAPARARRRRRRSCSNQPEWVEEFRPEEKPAIAVLWDASPSMETRDVVAGRQAVGPADDPPRGDRAADRARRRGAGSASG